MGPAQLKRVYFKSLVRDGGLWIGKLSVSSILAKKSEAFPFTSWWISGVIDSLGIVYQFVTCEC